MDQKPIVSEENFTKVHVHEKIFQIVENKGSFVIAVANKIVTTNNFATLDEAKAYIDSKPWELVINVTCLIYDMGQKKKKNSKK